MICVIAARSGLCYEMRRKSFMSIKFVHADNGALHAHAPDPQAPVAFVAASR